MVGRNDKLRFLGVLKDEVLVGPEKVVIHITNRCNFRCLYCFYHSAFQKRIKVKNDIDFGFFKEIVDSCCKLGVDIISLSGSGEPTLHPKIWNMIDYIKSKEMTLSLITNGSFDKKFLKHIMKVDFLTVSLSAVTEEKHREMQCGSKNMFRRIIKNLFFLSEIKSNGNISKPFIQLNYVLNKKNYKDIEKVFYLSKKIKTGKINFRIIIPISANDKITFSRKNILGLKKIIEKIKNNESFSNIDSNLNDVYEIVSDLAFQKTGHPYRNYSSKLRPNRCYSGWYYISIDNDGNIIPCCQIPWMSVGNVYKNPLNEIWESKKFHKIRLNGKYRMHSNKFIQCNFCFLRDINNKIYEKINRLNHAPQDNNVKM